MVFTERERYRVGCGGLVDATFAGEMLDEGKAGVIIEGDVVGASASLFVGSSASGGRGGMGLVVVHFCGVLVFFLVAVLCPIELCMRRECVFGLCGGLVYNYIHYFHRHERIRFVSFVPLGAARWLPSSTVNCGFSSAGVHDACCACTVGW